MSVFDSWLERSLHSIKMDQILLSSDSARYFCSLVFNNPLTWWILILLGLYLMEVFQLGPHSLPWNWRREKNSKNTKECKNGSLKASYSNGIGPYDECDGSTVPDTFHRFVRTKIIPTFRMQCKDSDERFAVLVFSHVTSLRDVRHTRFRQITFNGQPLVNPSLVTYPEAYRYENYVVARPDGNNHPEVLITKQVPNLLAGFGKAERCYIRNPIPTFGILYCSSLPCSQCTGKIIDSLSTVCRKRMVVAYGQQEDDDTKEAKANFQRMVDAGISVVKIDTKQ